MNDDEIEINSEETLKTLKKVYDKMTIKDIIIIALTFLLILMYIFHTREIAGCISYYQQILEESINPIGWINLTKI